jgi:hypothetical protein
MDKTEDHTTRAVASATAARVPIVNPYLKTSKAKQDKWSQTTPMTGFLLSSVIQPKSTPGGDTQNSDPTEHGGFKESPHEDESSELPVETKGPTVLHQEPLSLSVLPEEKLQHQVPMGENLAIQHRLPSRTVSFQSAEHLSVMELHSHRHYYQDRSVRIAGIILHRHIVESDASICFVLGDALEAARPKGRRSNQTPNTPQGRGKGVTMDPQIGTTPHSSKREIKTLGPAKTPLNRTTLYDKTPHSSLSGKRKLIHVPRSSGSNSLLSRSKRRLSFSTPTESALRCLISQPTFLVIVDPLQHPHAADCGVGDNVMVIGEVVLHDSNNPLAEPFLSLYRKKLERMADNDTKDNHSHHHDESAPSPAGSSSTTIHYVVPRILRNVNGTNLRLQYDALLKRRAHVVRISYDPNHPGRGPPPLPHDNEQFDNDDIVMTLTPPQEFHYSVTQPETQKSPL